MTTRNSSATVLILRARAKALNSRANRSVSGGRSFMSSANMVSGSRDGFCTNFFSFGEVVITMCRMPSFVISFQRAYGYPGAHGSLYRTAAVQYTQLQTAQVNVGLRSRPELRLSSVFAFTLIHRRASRDSRNWEMQNEHASLPGVALDADAPAVRRDDVFDQAQPQSVATNLRRSYFFATIERLEDAFLLGRRDAKPAIRDPDLSLFAIDRLYRLGAQSDPAAVAAVFHRVAEQVLNRAAQSGGVGFDRRQIGRDLSFDLEVAFSQLQVAGRDCVFNDLA